MVRTLKMVLGKYATNIRSFRQYRWVRATNRLRVGKAYTSPQHRPRHSRGWLVGRFKGMPGVLLALTWYNDQVQPPCLIGYDARIKFNISDIEVSRLVESGSLPYEPLFVISPPISLFCRARQEMMEEMIIATEDTLKRLLSYYQHQEE